MAFFLIKVADEVAAGDLSGAIKTLTGGVEPEIKAIETDTGSAFQAFLAVFAPAEASTLLSSIATTLTNGIKAGLGALSGGTAANAAAGAGAAAGSLGSDA